MIDEDITYREKGYYITDLNHGSHKEVWRVCDGCEEGTWVSFCQYRDLCNACAKKKNRKYDYDDNVVMSIDEDKTFREKGYRSSDLSARSGKEVYAVCIECGEGRWIRFCSYRDLCHSCAISKPTSDKTKKLMSDARKGDKCYNWKGGKSFEPYCEKFNEALKEEVREKFGRKCFACDKTEEENERKLSVHHVNYDKECICNGKDCEFAPLCVSCHSKTNYDRELWERLIINVLYYEGWID